MGTDIGHASRPLFLRTSWLWGGLVFFLGGLQLCLWRFLGTMPGWAYLAGLAALLIVTGASVTLIERFEREREPVAAPALGTFLVCLLFALAMLTLGGEGRFFYSNVDWQVRYAVLRDMATHPWPFVYTDHGLHEVLRAPLGMFFLPALGWKLAGPRAADMVLLVQNALFLATVLTLAARLFDTARARLLALGIVTLFSGLDIIGRLLTGPFTDHLENWGATQFSSTVTLAFWVPHHALPGWMGAIGFLLWQRGRLPLAALLAPFPLMALWSPLALFGLVPFAAYAGLTELLTRRLRWSAIALPALASALAVPGLIYLGAAGDSVGLRFYPIEPGRYWLFQLAETLPYLVPLYALARQRGTDATLLLAVALLLLAAPFVQIGEGLDFSMRATIPALLILALLAARALLAGPARPWSSVLIAALVVGAVTPATEIVRALRHPPAPVVRCSLIQVWPQSFGHLSMHIYLAPMDRMPALVRPKDPAPIGPDRAPRCWEGHWYHPSGV